MTGFPFPKSPILHFPHSTTQIVSIYLTHPDLGKKMSIGVSLQSQLSSLVIKVEENTLGDTLLALLRSSFNKNIISDRSIAVKLL